MGIHVEEVWEVQFPEVQGVCCAVAQVVLGWVQRVPPCPQAMALGVRQAGWRQDVLGVQRAGGDEGVVVAQRVPCGQARPPLVQGRRAVSWQVVVVGLLRQGPWVQVSSIFEVGLVQRQAVLGLSQRVPP